MPAEGAVCVLGTLRKVEEPRKVVEDDQEAGRDKLYARQRDERPGFGKVLEVDQMAEDPEYREVHR